MASTPNAAEQQDFRDILDAALDDLDDDDGVYSTTASYHHQQQQQQPETPDLHSETDDRSSNNTPVMGPEPPPDAVDLNEAETILADMIKELMNFEGNGGPPTSPSSPEDEQLQRIMEAMRSELQSPPSQTTTTSASPTTPTATAKTSSTTPAARGSSRRKPPMVGTPGSTVDDTISNLIEDMSKKHSKIENDDDDDDEHDEDSPEKDMLKSMMEELGGGGLSGMDDFDSDALIDGMMEQLVSKDLMYEPMKQVADKFPDWLDKHRRTLSNEEYGK